MSGQLFMWTSLALQWSLASGSRTEQTNACLLNQVCHMSDQTNNGLTTFDLEAEALMALEKARAMPRGVERAEALKKAGALQNTALSQCILFNKRGRPAK
jgi:hypothetical protein